MLGPFIASLAAALLAQAAPSTAPPNAAAQAAPADAGRLIRQAGAEGVFEVESNDPPLKVRHLKSGMVCSFEPTAPANSLKVFDSGPARGDDVGCNTQFKAITASLFANRASAVGGLEGAARAAVSALKTRWPDATAYSGKSAEMKDQARPPVQVARFVIVSDGRRMFTRAAAMRVGDWVVTQRITAPEDVALAADIYSEAMLTTLAHEMAENQARR